MNSYLGFVVCAAIIFFAGKKLSFFGDLLSQKTGLGKAWIGLILMASVTSLPELIVGVSSSAIVESADLAVGDILGSCTFNLAILACLDFFIPQRKNLFFIASPRHVLSAAMGIVLISVTTIGLFLPRDLVILPGIGIISIICIIIYFFSIRIIYSFEKVGVNKATNFPLSNAHLISLKRIIGNYVLYSVIIIISALFLPYFADQIAEKTNLGKTFVGTLFVAVSTSLPEIAVSIAAVRSNSVDLAVGNLLGSNIFNILILVIDDIFYVKGVLLKDASDLHIISALSAIIMTAIAIAGFTYKAEFKKFRIAPDAFFILLFYLVNILLLLYLSNQS